MCCSVADDVSVTVNDSERLVFNGSNDVLNPTEPTKIKKSISLYLVRPREDYCQGLTTVNKMRKFRNLTWDICSSLDEQFPFLTSSATWRYKVPDYHLERLERFLCKKVQFAWTATQKICVDITPYLVVHTSSSPLSTSSTL